MVPDPVELQQNEGGAGQVHGLFRLLSQYLVASGDWLRNRKPRCRTMLVWHIISDGYLNALNTD